MAVFDSRISTHKRGLDSVYTWSARYQSNRTESSISNQNDKHLQIKTTPLKSKSSACFITKLGQLNQRESSQNTAVHDWEDQKRNPSSVSH